MNETTKTKYEIPKRLYNNPSFINMAAFCRESTALGPGIRSVVWVQGCPFHCPGCIAPDWIPQIDANLIPVKELAEDIFSSSRVTGLTLSGGEPMLQATSLVELVQLLREVRDMDVICFTGFRLDQLLHHPPNPGVAKLLTNVDLLIDGLYKKDLNNDRGLRGSTNQNFHHLTNRLSGYDFVNVPRHVEVHVNRDHLLMVGIPSYDQNEAFNRAFERFNSINTVYEWT